MKAKRKYQKECSWVRYCYRNNHNHWDGFNDMTQPAVDAYRALRVSFTGWKNKGRQSEFIARSNPFIV